MTERQFTTALAGGVDVVFDAAVADGVRTLKGEWISRALPGATATRIVNAVIEGAVELERASVPGALTFVDCRLERFTAQACRFSGPVYIFGSNVREIDVSGSFFERAFWLRDVECALLDVGATSFSERFAVDDSSIGRLLNDPHGPAAKRALPYALTPKSIAAAVRCRPRTAAVVASLVLHLVVSLFISLQRVRPAAESVSTVQRLVFERKPAPTPRPTTRPPLARHVAIVPRAPVVPARSAPRTTSLPHIASKSVLVPPAHSPPKELAKIVPRAAPERPRVLSDSRIAQIENGLRSAIASDRGRIDPLAGTTSAIAGPKHYTADAFSFGEGDRRHHGLCDPIKDWTQGDYDYYFVACNVRFSDGTFQRQAVPWPVRFPKRDDPFNGTAAGEKPLAMPLPGWRLPPGETVTPELREYARASGVDLDAAE